MLYRLSDKNIKKFYSWLNMLLKKHCICFREYYHIWNNTKFITTYYKQDKIEDIKNFIIKDYKINL